ncbi:MAG: hypothetical protein P8X79_08955 [Reinekea sp.]
MDTANKFGAFLNSSLLPNNWGEPMGAPAIFEKQIEIKPLHSASTEGVTNSGIQFLCCNI